MKLLTDIMSYWKIILAIAILAVPLSYCEIESTKLKEQTVQECIKQKGEWHTILNYCDFSYNQ